MTNELSRKTSRGLTGLLGKLALGASVGAAALVPAGKASGEYLLLNNSFLDNEVEARSVYLLNNSSATDGLDNFDIENPVLPVTPPITPTVNFYSLLSDNTTQLYQDSRNVTENTVFHNVMQPNWSEGYFGSSQNGTLSFLMADPAHDFGSLPILASISKNGFLVPGLENINVREYANLNTIPISLGSGESYTVDVRFTSTPEPGTMSLLVMAGIAGAGALAYSSLKKRKQE
ncbi:Uncharacterised protein [uncultured archaeon]|nr:Uncharacterised protein [uncultured archaeon]